MDPLTKGTPGIGLRSLGSGEGSPDSAARLQLRLVEFIQGSGGLGFRVLGFGVSGLGFRV